jgi:hypothetical protein
MLIYFEVKEQNNEHILDNRRVSTDETASEDSTGHEIEWRKTGLMPNLNHFILIKSGNSDI